MKNTRTKIARSSDEIRKMFGGKIHGTKKMQSYICRTLAKFPKDIIDHITTDCWFLCSTDDAWAYVFRGDEIRGKHVIVLTDSLWNQPDADIIYTIAHEISHLVLGHRNAILAPQSKSQINRQEKEAGDLAMKYISREEKAF